MGGRLDGGNAIRGCFSSLVRSTSSSLSMSLSTLTIFSMAALVLLELISVVVPQVQAQSFSRPMPSSSVQLLVEQYYVILDNGIVRLTLTNPKGDIVGVSYNGINNMLEGNNGEDNRGYWDIAWSNPPGSDNGASGWSIHGSEFKVIQQQHDVVEVSFLMTWEDGGNMSKPSLNIDKRFVMLRGKSGFYAYAIFEHQQGWPDLNIYNNLFILKLDTARFEYMAIADDRQRMMPSNEDCALGRAVSLGFKEAMKMVDPIHPQFKGQVDDKYQYSMENQHNKVHGWISSYPAVGFWMITPSNEFKSGGPIKQELTSHRGPTMLSVFHSGHYIGEDNVAQITQGEDWKKVFGPIFMYMNSNPEIADNSKLWKDAKSRAQKEVTMWPYTFVASKDFLKANERGLLRGRFLVNDRFHTSFPIPASPAHIGLAPPGNLGSWQIEAKGYQFWTQPSRDGSFIIKNVRPGTYNLYAWVPGFIGDYKYADMINITSGEEVNLGDLVYEPPRDGPTLWEIGIPDRSAVEFYVPDPNPEYINPLYANHPDKFRQYGLWDRYTDLYPNNDLVYTVGSSNYTKDWFYAHVNRKIGNDSHESTAWQIRFNLDHVVTNGNYKLRLALASASTPILDLWFNKRLQRPHFSTGHIRSWNNVIARHGIHGMHWLFTVDVQSDWLVPRENILYLTQTLGGMTFVGLMYDYLRLEGPSD